MSSPYQRNEYQRVIDAGPIIEDEGLNWTSAHNFWRQEEDNLKWYRMQRVKQMSGLVYSETSQNVFKSYGSWPNDFLSTLPVSNQNSIELSSSDCFSEQDSSQDTESFANSNDELDNELVNEVKSRLEADDELASIFGSNETWISNSSNTRVSDIQRPHNPIVYDKNFIFPRCSAPSIEKQPLASHFYISKPMENYYNSQFE